MIASMLVNARFLYLRGRRELWAIIIMEQSRMIVYYTFFF